MYAGVCVGSCIDTLAFIETVGLPVGELSAFGDALMEEIGPKFLKTEVFYAHARCNMLEVNVAGGMKSLMTMGEHAPIIMEREANLEYCRVFQKIDETLRKAH